MDDASLGNQRGFFDCIGNYFLLWLPPYQIGVLAAQFFQSLAVG